MNQIITHGNTPDIWDANWTTLPSLKEMQFNVYQEGLSAKFAKVDRQIRQQFGTYRGLRVLEVGAGLGTYSILFAQRGAEITLLDYSTNALEGVRHILSYFELSAKLIEANALQVSDEISERYDVVMSFGLVEHFDGSPRQQIITAHRQLQNERGLSVIETPNRFCLPYRLWKFYLEQRGKWQLGLEKPFTHRELRRLAKQAGFQKIAVQGAPLKGYQSDFRAHIWNFVEDKLTLRETGHDLKYMGQLKPQRESWQANYFGRSLILFGSG